MCDVQEHREGAGSAREVSTLLTAVQSGDANAAAEFMRRYGPIIRQRFRARLSRGLRRLMDSGDLISTVSRRFLQAVMARETRFEAQEQLFAYVHTVAERVIAHHGRVMSRLRTAESEDGPLATALLQRIERNGPDERGLDDTIDYALGRLTSADEQRMLSLWLSGQNLAEIAAEMGIGHAAARTRWMVLRQRLAGMLEGADVR